jgi:hypothetical protein
LLKVAFSVETVQVVWCGNQVSFYTTVSVCCCSFKGQRAYCGASVLSGRSGYQVSFYTTVAELSWWLMSGALEGCLNNDYGATWLAPTKATLSKNFPSKSKR